MVFRTTYEKISGVIHIVLDNAKNHKCKKFVNFLKNTQKS